MVKFIYRKTIHPLWQFTYDRLIHPIFQIKDSPHSIALGLAIGLWVSLTPTVGLQMTICVILCAMVRANILIAVAMCWISNPVTFIPMYYGYYRLGLVVTNVAPTPWSEFREMLQNDYVVFAQKEPEAETRARILYSKKKAKIYKKMAEACRQKKITPLKGITLENTSGHQFDGGTQELLQEVKKTNDYGLVDWITWSKIEKNANQAGLKIVNRIRYEQTFWTQTMTLLALGFKAFAIPMWLGSLILATIFAIPSYFFALRAIIRYRKKNPLSTSLSSTK